MKKRVLAALLACAMVAGLAACGSTAKESEAKTEETDAASEEKKEETKEESKEMTAEEEEEAWKKEPMYGKTIKYAYSGGNCVGACHVANLLGFYEEEGITNIEALAGQSAIDSTATNQTQIFETHIAHATVPIVNGLNLYMVGTAQTGCQSLYVLADSDYKKTTDLKGKAVAIPSGFGSPDHNIVLRFMAKDGLGVNDYDFKVVETSAVVAALQSGELQASLLPDMFAYQFVAKGVLRAIRSITTDADFKEEPCCTVLMNKDFVDENPITAKKIERAIAKASAWIDSHTEESVDFMLENKMMSLSQTDTSLKSKLVELQGSYDWTVTDAVCDKTLRSLVKDYQSFGLIDSKKTADEIVDSFWKPLLTDEELEKVWAEGNAFTAK